jgi:hypothetical protein
MSSRRHGSMKTRRMCPNETCEKHGQPTGLLGGCDCGTPLVPYKAEPTDEQLERVMIAMGVPAGVAMTMTRSPTLREGALRFHALVQRALDGDREAVAQLSVIQDHFSRSEVTQ